MSNAVIVEEDKFHIRRNGDTRGPFSLEQLRYAFEAGQVPLDSKVAPEGAKQWEGIRDFLVRHGVAVDAPDAQRVKAPPLPRSSSAGPWRKVTAIGAVLTPLAIVACAVLAWKVHEEDAISAKADTAALRAAMIDVAAAVRSTTAVTWVRARDTANNCHATNQSFECVITNASDQPIEACFVGVLAQKKGGGIMKSFPLCTGRVAPRETREVSVPWARGSAADICNKLTYGDNRILDFDACDFDTEAIDPGGSGWAAPRTP